MNLIWILLLAVESRKCRAKSSTTTLTLMPTSTILTSDLYISSTVSYYTHTSNTPTPTSTWITSSLDPKPSVTGSPTTNQGVEMADFASSLVKAVSAAATPLLGKNRADLVRDFVNMVDGVAHRMASSNSSNPTEIINAVNNTVIVGLGPFRYMPFVNFDGVVVAINKAIASIQSQVYGITISGQVITVFVPSTSSASPTETSFYKKIVDDASNLADLVSAVVKAASAAATPVLGKATVDEIKHVVNAIDGAAHLAASGSNPSPETIISAVSLAAKMAVTKSGFSTINVADVISSVTNAGSLVACQFFKHCPPSKPKGFPDPPATSTEPGYKVVARTIAVFADAATSILNAIGGALPFLYENPIFDVISGGANLVDVMAHAIAADGPADIITSITRAAGHALAPVLGAFNAGVISDIVNSIGSFFQKPSPPPATPIPLNRTQILLLTADIEKKHPNTIRRDLTPFVSLIDILSTHPSLVAFEIGNPDMMQSAIRMSNWIFVDIQDTGRFLQSYFGCQEDAFSNRLAAGLLQFDK